MANHVSSRIELVEGNEEVTKWFENLTLSMLVPEEDKQGIFDYFKPVHEMFDEWNESESEQETYGWYIDNIGAKWCHLEDTGDAHMSFESAWGYPGELFLRIHQEAHKIDPDVIMSIYYDDEGPNFFGSGLYADGEMYDEEYWDSDNYHHIDIKFWWDEEEDGPEPDDFDSSEAYEKMYDIQYEDVQGMIEGLKEYRAEIAEENASN